MWRALFTACVLACVLQHASSLSFFSQVFFRMLFPKPQPKVEGNKLASHKLKRTLSFVEVRYKQMNSKNSPEKTVESLVYSFIATSKEIIPNEFDLPDNTYELPLKGKLILNSGKVKGLRSYGDPTIDTTVDSEGNMKFVVTIQFDYLEVVFNDMYLDYYGRLFDKKGTGKFKIVNNKFLANLNVVKTTEVFERITKNQCVIYFVSIKALEISDVSVDIYNENEKRAFYSSALIDVVITSLQEMLKEQLTNSLTELILSALPEENGFVCKESGLKYLTDLIKNNQGAKKTKVLTENQPPIPAGTSTQSETSPAAEQPPDAPHNKGQENRGWFGTLKSWWTGTTDFPIK